MYYFTSKHSLVEKISGNESINSERYRLEGQIEHLYHTKNYGLETILQDYLNLI